MRLAVAPWSVLCGLLLLGCGRGESAPGAGGPEPHIAAARVTEDGVEFPAVVDRAAFEGPDSPMPGYHYVVWHEGRSAHAALFRSPISDRTVVEALESLGLEPGNALDMDTWEERHDQDATAPDRLIEGPPVEVLVRLPGRHRLLAPEDILQVVGGRAAADPSRPFQFRFGGHVANIPAWHSGCVVCLVSCPGSKIGNRAYTVRQWTRGLRFAVRPGVLPPDGTGVTIVVRIDRPAARKGD